MGTPRFRSRTKLLGDFTPAGTVVGKINKFTNNNLVSTEIVISTGNQPSQLIELTWDQKNPIGRKGPRRSPANQDVGGPFCSVKVRVPSSERKGLGVYSTKGNPNFSPGSWWEYRGYFVNPNVSFDDVGSGIYTTAGGGNITVNPLIPALSSLESSAFVRLMPKISRASLLNSFIELPELPTDLRQRAADFKRAYKVMLDLSPRYRQHQIVEALKAPAMSKKLADEWLANQFGWVPFVKDVTQALDAVMFSQQYLADITRQNNTWVKRKATLLDDLSSTRIKRLYSPGCEPSGSQLLSLCRDMVLDGVTCQGYMDVYKDVKKLVWAEGSFKFYRPEFDNSLPTYGGVVSTVNRYLTLTGLRVTPTHIWNAIPWSWLIDWWSNMGDLIKAADAQATDGMVSKFLYGMNHQVTTCRSMHIFNFWSGALALNWTRTIDVKVRRKGESPYGFVLGGDLSPRQWSILVALGLSRDVSRTRLF